VTKQCANCQNEISVTEVRCNKCSYYVGGALSHLRVLDLTGPGFQYAGRIMADLGADVIQVEGPEGDIARFERPFAGKDADPEKSITFLTYNLNKRGIILDLNETSDQERLKNLVQVADILLEDGSKWNLDSLGLGYGALHALNPGLIHTTITPFGFDGPYKDYLGGELVAQALGGLMYGYGDPDMRPAMAPLAQGSQLAAQHAAMASLIALRYRNRSGKGQHIEVAVQEVLANILAYMGRYANSVQINRRVGASTNNAPTNTYPCSDGFVYMQPGYPRHVEALYEWMDNDLLKDEIWKDREFRRENGDVLEALVSEFSSDFSKLEFHNEAQRRHIPTSPLMTIEDLINDEHLGFRNYYVSVDHPVVGSYQIPGAPYRMGESPWRIYRPAPTLGQHTSQVIREWREDPAPEKPNHAEIPIADGEDGDSPLPLRGLRILDFSRVWAGPFMTRYLAELGAEVIKIESHMLPDRAQAVGAFNFNFAEKERGKQSITLNMSHEGAMPIMEKLIQESDCVVENFRSGVLEGWGLGYERMRQLNPGIIYLSMPGFGNSGPNSDQLSYGQSLAAYSGLMNLWAHPESYGRTRPKVPLPDFIAAVSGACGILSALEYRDMTGKGQMIELAQLEGLVTTMGVAFADYSLNGHIWEPAGNRNPNAAPHDVFLCQGFDAWCAIACYNDEQWEALRTALDNPTWSQDTKFSNVEGRLANLEELNSRIGDWTSERTPREAMRLLQEAGVPAGMVSNAEDLYYDPNLRARDYILTVDHRPVFGVLEHPGPMVRLSGTPSRVVGPCPELGQHNETVFGGLLGMSSAEIESLVESKVIY